MSAKRFKIKLGNSKQPRHRDGSKMWPSGFCKLGGKFWKRRANRAARRSDVTSGGGYKRAWGPFEWS